MPRRSGISVSNSTVIGSILLFIALCLGIASLTLSIINRVNPTVGPPGPAGTNGTITNSTNFDNSIIVNVTNSNDNSFLGNISLQWVVYKNIYTFFLGYLYIPDTGIAQDVIFVDFPFNYPDPRPLNPSDVTLPQTIFTNIIVCGDIQVIMNCCGDFNAGTIMLFDLKGLYLGLTGWRIMIYPNKLLDFDVGAIPLNSQMSFGQALFSVAFNFTV